MSIVANYYAITDEQVKLYQVLAKESSKSLIEALKALPTDEHFVSIGGLWDGLHYFINNQDSDPMFNRLADDKQIALYCSFFGGGWLKEEEEYDEIDFDFDDEPEFSQLLNEMQKNPDLYFYFLQNHTEIDGDNRYGFVYLSIIKESFLSETVKAFQETDIDGCALKYPEPNTFRKYKLFPYTDWEKQSNEFLLQEFKHNFLKFQQFYENAVKNNRSVLVAIRSW